MQQEQALACLPSQWPPWRTQNGASGVSHQFIFWLSAWLPGCWGGREQVGSSGMFPQTNLGLPRVSHARLVVGIKGPAGQVELPKAWSNPHKSVSPLWVAWFLVETGPGKHLNTNLNKGHSSTNRLTRKRCCDCWCSTRSWARSHRLGRLVILALGVGCVPK